MRKILVISDIHLTGDGTRIIGLDPLARFRAVLDAAAAAHPDAAALVLLGDLAHHASPAAYAELRQALGGLPFPVLPMLGNHDRRAPFRAAFPDAPADGAGFVQGVTDLPGHRIVTLDTLEEGSDAGRLCAARLAWLDEALAGAGSRVPLVFAHHPPFPVGLPGMDAIALQDPGPLLDRLSRAPGAHLFCGHIHRTISGSHRGLPWTIFKSPCHQCPLDLEDPSSSISVDEPGAYGLLLLPEGGVIAHSVDVGLDAVVHRDTTPA